MRQINRICTVANTPNKLNHQDTLDEWEAIATSGNASLIDVRIYRDPYDGKFGEGKNSRVIDKLNEWYNGKCAYCERFYKLDVDHYRPKGEVWDENNNVIRANGYYWLCYEWSNLIPACITCNREGGKLAKFPFLPGGHQVINPPFNADGTLNKILCNSHDPTLTGELPSLLNPEVDTNFQAYFSFNLEANMQGIRINGIDASGRGMMTIRLCNLNKSETRRERVQSVVKHFSNSISATIKRLEAHRINYAGFKNEIESHIQKLYDDSNDDELDHTLLRKFIVLSPQNFNSIVIPFITEKFREIIKEAFFNYIPI